MRRENIAKSNSIFTVFLFSWAILWSNAFYGDAKQPLSEARELYENREYEKAIVKLNDLVAMNIDESEKKDLVSEAYYLLSKIYFELREDLKMEENLRQLFLLVPDFSKIENNPVFEKTFEKIKNDPLIKSNRLYKEADYAGALSILDEFVKENQTDESKKQQLAFAYYLLAKIYFDTRFEDQIDLNLQKIFEADPAFQIKENDMAFKFRLERVRKERMKNEQAPVKAKEEERPVLTKISGKDREEIVKPEAEKPKIIEKSAAEKRVSKKKKFPWLLVGGLAVGAGLLALFLTKKRKDSLSETQTGDIYIRSNPSGAIVYLDGNKLNKITPCTLPNINVGMHAMKIEHELCKTWEGNVEVKLHQVTNVDVALTRFVEFISKWSGANLIGGLDVDKSGCVYVVDGSSKVKKFSSNGTLLTLWNLPPPEWNDYEVLGTTDVCVSNSNYVYVTQTSDEGPIQRVIKFTTSGRFISKWGRLGTGNYEFEWPNAVATDSFENVYIADIFNHRILKYNSKGSFLQKWAITKPWDICIDHSNYIYVTDTNCIKKYTSNGIYITKWGSKGDGDNQFNPLGVTTDLLQCVYIADGDNHRIMKFSSTGKYILKWGSQGKGDYQFDSPSKMAMSDAGYFYVADTGNNRIMKFRINSIATATATISYSDNIFYPDSPKEILKNCELSKLERNQQNKLNQKELGKEFQNNKN